MGKTTRQRNKEWMEEFKSKQCCAQCGESHSSCLEFHHVNPEEKAGEVMSFVNGGAAIAKIKKEINKCTILCANCHRKLHYEERVNGH